MIVFANRPVGGVGNNQGHDHIGFSDSDGRLDVWVKLVVLDDKIFVLVIKETVRLARDLQCWVREGLPAKLKLDLLEVIAVNMAVTACPDEFANLEATLLRDHVG